MKVKAYDLKTLVEKECESFTTYREHKVVIIEGPNGVIVTDDDACHSTHVNTGITYQVELSKVTDPNSNKISMVPEAMIKPTITELLKAPSEDVELGDFVRKFGSRIENNYRTLLDSIKVIGLNPTDYPRK